MHDHQHKIFLQKNCFRFAKIVNKTTITNTFNSDNSNIAKIKTQHRQIMTTVTNGLLKFKFMIKRPVMANYTFFFVITLCNIYFLT